MNKWIRRKRNSWGYGVQSPNDFYFVQHVLREESPYYSYADIEKMTTHDDRLHHYKEAINKLLFRLANHQHPSTILEVGAGTSIFAMSMACPSAQCVAITPNTLNDDAMQSMLTKYPKIEIREGDEMALFHQIMEQNESIELLHIAHTPYYQEVVNSALPYVTNGSLFIIDGITDSKEKYEWWRGLQESSLTGNSYDLGSIGLLFFDQARHKESYWINLRR